MQLRVCFLLVFVAAATTTENDAAPIPHFSRDFPSQIQAGSDYTSTQGPYRGSEWESDPATPLFPSGSPDSKALQFPEEVGNNGAETSVTRLPEAAVLARNTQTNPGMPVGIHGSHTSGRVTFPTVTSSTRSLTLQVTPSRTMERVFLQNPGRTASGMKVFRKLISDPVLGSAWSQKDLHQTRLRATRLLAVTEGTWATTDTTIVPGRIQNLSMLGNETGMPRPTYRTSAKTESGRYLNFRDLAVGMARHGFSTQVGIAGLEASPEATGESNHSAHVSTVLPSGGGFTLSTSKDQNLGFSEEGMGTPGQLSHAITLLASGEVRNSEGMAEMARFTPQVGLLGPGASEDWTGMGGLSPRMSNVTTSDGFLGLEGPEDLMGTPGHSPHLNTLTASKGFVNFNFPDRTNMPMHSPQIEVLSDEGRTETPGRWLQMSTTVASRDVSGPSSYTPQTGDLNLSGSWYRAENLPHAGTILASGRVQRLSSSEAARLGHMPRVGVFSLGGSQDRTGISGHLVHAGSVTSTGEVFGFGATQNTDDNHYTTLAPATLKSSAFVSPSILDVLAWAHTSTSTPLITPETFLAEENVEKDIQGDSGTMITLQLIAEAQSVSTPVSSATSHVPKVYVAPDRPAIIKVDSIELLLQIVVDQASSASGPRLEKDTSAWVEPYLQRAPGFSRILGVWGSGHAVQLLLEFDSAGALRWLSASGASKLLRQMGLERAACQGRSFRGSKVLNVTLGGVQADVCDWLLECPAGFHCVLRPGAGYGCSSVCHFDFCHHHGVCAHHPSQLPVCRCLVGDDFWFMGSRCDVRMTWARLVCTCTSILALAVAVVASLALVAVRRYQAALIRAKVDQTRSSYRRFNHFDELSSRFWPRSASLAASTDSMDNPAFTRSNELLHMRALDRPCCYHDDTLSLTSVSSAHLNTVYPESSRYGWSGSPGDGGVLDSGKASDLSVCSWPLEPIHWTPFPLLRQLALPSHTPRAARASRPRSYCEGMELLDLNRSWTA